MFKQLNPLSRPRLTFRSALASIASAYFLAGCGTTLVRPEQTAPAPEPTPAPPKIEIVDDRPFESDTLYALMVAEFAGERKRYDVMLNNYVQQAEHTKDPGVTARASRIARFLKARGPSLDMALLWTELEGDNPEAHYNATAELVAANRLEEAFDHAVILFERGEVAGFDAIGAQALRGGDIQVTKKLIPRYQALIDKHPKQESLYIGLSFLLQHAGDISGSVAAIKQAGNISPDNAQIAMQAYQLLNGAGRTEEAQATLESLVTAHPDNVRLRLQLARSLLTTDIEAAETQFQLLHDQHPEDKDIYMTLALVQYERGKLDDAASKLSTLLDNEKHHSAARYYLGRIALVKGQDDEAITHFKAVEPGSDYLAALSQLADLLARKGQLAEALKLVTERKRAINANDDLEELEGLYIIESHLYSSNGKLPEAIASLSAGLKNNPQSARMLYSRAMLYTQMGDLPRAESDFLSVLSVDPNNAATLNAYGYTLAVETDRLEEAAGYVAKAYELEPDNPAVIDSMGWIEFLRGNNDIALVKLKRAMHLMPDHEIAAHLGEVLWMAGAKEEARSAWQQGLKLKPNSDIIRETLIRLKVQPPVQAP